MRTQSCKPSADGWSARCASTHISGSPASKEGGRRRRTDLHRSNLFQGMLRCRTTGPIQAVGPEVGCDLPPVLDLPLFAPVRPYVGVASDRASPRVLYLVPSEYSCLRQGQIRSDLEAAPYWARVSRSSALRVA